MIERESGSRDMASTHSEATLRDHRWTRMRHGGAAQSVAESAGGTRGASLVTILIIVFFVLMVATFALKFGTSYTQFMTLRGILAEVVEEPNAAARNMNQTWPSIERRLRVNSIYGRERDDFSLIDVEGVRYLVAEYEVRKPFIANIDVVTRFRHDQPFE